MPIRPAREAIVEQRPIQVLVVDDEPDVRELLVEYLRSRSFDVSAAGDGRAAITALKRSPTIYKLIFIDLQLPGVSGLEVLKAAKEVNPSCYVVIITGYASLDSAVQAVRLGAYDYLTKPFSLGQIDVIVQRVTDRLILEVENRQLARQVGEREVSGAAGELLARLGAIESRLAQMELLLREMGNRSHGKPTYSA